MRLSRQLGLEAVVDHGAGGDVLEDGAGVGHVGNNPLTAEIP